MSQLKFSILLALLLAFPAALQVFDNANIVNGQINFEYSIPGYLYAAAPHVLVAMLAFWSRCRQPTLLFVLVWLNILLVLFWLWIKFDVPPYESTMAWVLYIPLWMIALVVSGLLSWLIKRHRVKALAQTS